MGTLRDLALILLALETALGTLVVLALMAAINYALFYFRWWEVLPRWFAIARGYLLRGQRAVESGSRVVASPVFTLVSTWAGVRAVAGSLRDGQKGRGTAGEGMGEIQTSGREG